MNFHSDKWIMDCVQEHYNDALKHFPEDRIVGIFLQGSQNYGLDYSESDIDTKLIVVPTFEDIAMNRKPVSTTHVRANDEHIDFKDIRLYLGTFRKQNLNFLEILYTPYFIINPLYEEQWNRLVSNREAITHFNPYRAVKSMKGIALEKYHAMCHEYPSKIEIIKKYKYDGKQTSHQLRVEDYLERYIAGEPYGDCLIPSINLVDEIMDFKMQKIPYEDAQKEADESLARIAVMTDKFFEAHEDKEDPEVNALLDDVQLEVMRIAMKKELEV